MVISFIGLMPDAWAENLADVKLGRNQTAEHTDMGFYNKIMLTHFPAGYLMALTLTLYLIKTSLVRLVGGNKNEKQSIRN